MRKSYFPLTLSALSVPLALSACDDNTQNPQSNSTETWFKSDPPKTYFESFDELNKLLSYRTYADSDIELGELDGEGNLNVVVSNFRRKGKVFENRIPQKNKSFQNENKNAR